MDFFGPLVIDKMRVQFKRANKIHVLLFIINCHVPIIVSFNPLHTKPVSATNATQDPFEASEVHCVPRYILKYSALKPGAQQGTCPQRFGRWQRVGEYIFIFYGKHVLLVTEFSALKPKMLSYQEVSSLFVCLFFSPFLCTPKAVPHFPIHF